MKRPLLIVFLLLAMLPSRGYSHGVTSATARIAVRPGGIIELKVQFNLIHLLNHKTHDYSLPAIASLPEEKFGLLYDETVKLFTRDLSVKIADSPVELHSRIPSQREMLNLLKREFIESKFSKKSDNTLYTFSDRRFYQVFYFDFRVSSRQDLENISIDFPDELGTVYVTYTESTNREVHPGQGWTHHARSRSKAGS